MFGKKWRTGLLLASLGAFTIGTANAAMIMGTAGEQDHNNGDTLTTGDFDVAGGGEAAPFNAFIGSDISAGGASANFGINYLATSDPILSASIMLGLYDHDSAASGNQIVLFTVDGFDFTVDLSALAEASGGAQGEANVYTVSLSGAGLFTALSDGSANVVVSVGGPGLGLFGETAGNGFGVDFAKITIETDDGGGGPGPVIPEPTTVLLLGTGIAGLLWRQRRHA